jgi:LuxR family maltose regulon positive regulatory protein
MLEAAVPQVKVCPPRMRADLVQRASVADRLRRCVGSCKLVVFCAPAGYGKTAALAQFVHQREPADVLAWVTASDGDDLHRLVACLVAALDPHDLPWRVSPEALPEMSLREGGLRLVADHLLRALDEAQVHRALIVIDDLHRLVDPNIYEFLQLLLSRLPQCWTIAVTTRDDSRMSLARMRAQHELVEFRTEDLRFRPEDAATISATIAVGANEATVGEWIRRTRGWPAGLMLSAMSYSPHGGVRQGMRYTFDYLTTEVMAGLPPALQDFLMRCSVLTEWTGSARPAREDDVRQEQRQRRGRAGPTACGAARRHITAVLLRVLALLAALGTLAHHATRPHIALQRR